MEGDYRANMVNLAEAPLSDDELLELAKRLRTVHSIANAWHAEQIVSDDFLYQLIQAAKQRGAEVSLPRLIVQTTISLLEAKQQNPEQDLKDLLPDALRDSMERIRQQERDRYRSQERDRYHSWE